MAPVSVKLRGSPVAVGAASFLLALSTTGVAIATFHGNPTALVHASTTVVHPSNSTAGLYLRSPNKSYDGIYFYRFARNPFSSRASEFGIPIKGPAYRHQRILYPVAAWALAAGGRRAAVGWSLVAVNVIAMGVIGWAGAVLARACGRGVWWGAALFTFPGLAISLLFDLSEVVSTFLVLLACVAIVRQRPVWTAVALSAAVLARETAVLLAAGVAVVAIADAIRRRRRRAVTPVLTAAAPFLVLAIWQVILRINWGAWADAGGAAGGGRNFGAPGRALLHTLARAFNGHLDQLASAGFAIGMLGLAGAAAVSWRKSEAPAAFKVAWVLSLLVGLFYAEPIWGSYISFLRVLADFGILSLLIVAAERGRRWADLAPLATGSGFMASVALELIFLR